MGRQLCVGVTEPGSWLCTSACWYSRVWPVWGGGRAFEARMHHVVVHTTEAALATALVPTSGAGPLHIAITTEVEWMGHGGVWQNNP